jgi:uracil-DNA glycosylase family protein
MPRKKTIGRSPYDLIESDASLKDLREAIQSCQGCDIWQRATQAVFGEGAPGAEVMFVGPAGKLLDQALAQAGIDRKRVYITNIVKHFNSTTRGKLRIHKKPNAEEIAACRPWLEAEIARVKPKVIVCLGATAAQALISREFRVSHNHGELMKSSLAEWIAATVHPSSILRSPDDESRHAATKEFVADLKKIARHLPPSALKAN